MKTWPTLTFSTLRYLLTCGVLAGFSQGATAQAATVAGIVISPQNPTVESLKAVQFTAIPVDSKGKQVAVTLPYKWAVANTAAGSVDGAKGLFVAKTVGTTTTTQVVASYGLIKATTNISVTAPKVVATPPAILSAKVSPEKVSIADKQTFSVTTTSPASKVLIKFPDAKIDVPMAGSGTNWTASVPVNLCYRSYAVVAYDSKGQAGTTKQGVLNVAVPNTLKDYALLADAIYSRKTQVNDWLLTQNFSEKQSGFLAGVYGRQCGSESVFVIAGTNPEVSFDMGLDLGTDLSLYSFKGTPRQFNAAFSALAQARSKSAISMIVGHSLGGSLAQYLGLRTGIKTITFNSAPFPLSETLRFLAKTSSTNTTFAAEGAIKNYRTPNDPISGFSLANTAGAQDIAQLKNLLNSLSFPSSANTKVSGKPFLSVLTIENPKNIDQALQLFRGQRLSYGKWIQLNYSTGHSIAGLADALQKEVLQ